MKGNILTILIASVYYSRIMLKCCRSRWIQPILAKNYKNVFALALHAYQTQIHSSLKDIKVSQSCPLTRPLLWWVQSMNEQFSTWGTLKSAPSLLRSHTYTWVSGGGAWAKVSNGRLAAPIGRERWHSTRGEYQTRCHTTERERWGRRPVNYEVLDYYVISCLSTRDRDIINYYCDFIQSYIMYVKNIYILHQQIVMLLKGFGVSRKLEKMHLSQKPMISEMVVF